MRFIMTYKPWEIVLLPFPFTDLSSAKKRPAIVLSSSLYNLEQDVVVLFLTSNLIASPKIGDYKLKEWKTSNLPKPSMVRMKFATIDKDYIIKKIGEVEAKDILNIKAEIKAFFSL